MIYLLLGGLVVIVFSGVLVNAEKFATWMESRAYAKTLAPRGTRVYYVSPDRGFGVGIVLSVTRGDVHPTGRFTQFFYEVLCQDGSTATISSYFVTVAP